MSHCVVSLGRKHVYCLSCWEQVIKPLAGNVLSEYKLNTQRVRVHRANARLGEKMENKERRFTFHTDNSIWPSDIVKRSVTTCHL